MGGGGVGLRGVDVAVVVFDGVVYRFRNSLAFSNSFARVRGRVHNGFVNQTSVRKLAGDKASQVAFLRAQMSKIAPAAAQRSPGSGPAVGFEAEDILEVPGPLARVLPGGGLARRQVTELNDCPALAAELVAQVSAGGGFVAVVGWVELSLAQLVDEGDVGRVITVPDPGPEPWQVTAVLLEGMDLVIHHGAPGELTPTRARPVLAKLRGGHAALVTVGPHLPGAPMSVQGEVTTYRGIGRGTGRIRGLDIEVRARTKAGQETSGLVTAGQARRLELA